MPVPSAVKSSATKSMKTSATGNEPPIVRPEAEGHGDEENDDTLDGGNGGAAESPADHEVKPRNRRDESFF